MAKKKKQSLTERIAALINRVGEKPEPTFGNIKSELVECLGLAETLENGALIRDLEAKATVLEAALEKSNLENSNLQAELQSLKTEVDGFRAERKKQEEEERQKDLPEIQSKILTLIPSEHGGERPTIGIVADTIGIQIYEAEIHLDRLREAKLIIHDHTGHITPVFYRTIKGNELILAKRLADEEGDDEIPYKYATLPKIVESILAMLIGEDEGVNERLIHQSLKDKRVKITLEKVKWILETSLKRFADYDPEEATYGTGTTWFITDAGREYFAERDKL